MSRQEAVTVLWADLWGAVDDLKPASLGDSSALMLCGLRKMGQMQAKLKRDTIKDLAD